MSTLFRQLTMLHLIPHRRKVTTKDVQQALANEGFAVSLRTVQRDLKDIEESGLFALEADTRSKPHGWRWDAQVIYDIPGMTPSLALAFVLARRYLLESFPPSVLERLKPHFNRAEKVLTEHTSPSLQRWPEKIAILPRQQRLIPAQVEPSVHEAIARALLEEKQIVALYQPRNREKREYILNPLGLVMRGSASYLVASVKDYDDAIHFALHRFISVDISGKQARVPLGFSLRKHLSDQAFDLPLQDQVIQLVALFDVEHALHLHETPLSEDQALVLQADGRERLSASVKDTQELRWWLLGFGDRAEVIEPVELRQAFANIAKNMSRRYQDADGG